MFAFCLGPSSSILTLGGDVSSHDELHVNYAPIVCHEGSCEGFYIVWMTHVAVGCVLLSTSENVLNKRGAIVETGTVLPTAAFLALRQKFELLCVGARWRVFVGTSLPPIQRCLMERVTTTPCSYELFLVFLSDSGIT